jgi:hypothetical protein
MGHPADAPGATAERVTVLIALDTDDGRMRSATELAGPAGGTQTSRTTWKLIDEQSFNSTSDASAPFEIGQAWNGQGQFPEALSHSIADLAMPLIPMTSLGDPARLLGEQSAPIWAPFTPPAGVDRALLLRPPAAYPGLDVPHALVYLGRDRRLIMRFNTAGRIDDAEQLTIGPWSAQLEPGRARSYRITLQRHPAPGTLDSVAANMSTPILIEAYGFSRAELIAVITSLRLFGIEMLSSQDSLFVRPGSASPAARAASAPLVGFGAQP